MILTFVVRKILRILTAFLAGGLVFACMGAIYQAVAMRIDADRFLQRGKSFDASGLRLNLDCSGQGGPAVILESGLGGPALDWVLVQPEVAKFTRVCSYDRAGYGWSDVSRAPRTSLQIAKELKALLDSAGETGPFLMVGHSFGGYNIRLFTGRYPQDVAGLVLVDASHPDEAKRIDTILTPAQRAAQQRSEIWPRIAAPLQIHLGLARIALSLGWNRSRFLSKRLQQEFLYLEQRPNYQRAIQAEDASWEASGAQAVAAGSLGARPLIVLTAGRPYELDPLLTPEQRVQQDQIWIHDLQVEEMHLSSRGRQIIVPDSGHDMPQERPGAIIAAIHSMWSSLH
ncbi:alpha/beta hydrolase [Bryobacter aggregatus]|uniref:alpha/beta hydrolase n=1 Tax=Bryobacter aggregatus TaxID=360054 RepID=UPI0004E19236|nr:alpha/beta hydrolase [Bryobacter aggregatus]